MSPLPMEAAYEAYWAGRQAAQASVLDEVTATSIMRLRKVAGGIGLNREDQAENFSDLTPYGDQQDVVGLITGQGDPGFQTQPEVFDRVLNWFMGIAPTTTGAADPFQHVFVPPVPPAVQTDIYTTWFKRVGSSRVLRQKFGDSLVAQLQIEGSTQNKIVRFTPTILSLEPGIVFATDPAALLNTVPAFAYTEGTGRFKIALAQDLANTVVVKGHTQFNITITRNLTPQQGDDVTPYLLFPGRPEITLTVTVFMDDVTHAQYNRLIYGNAAPVAGDKPTKAIPPLGSYTFDLQRPGDGALMTSAGSKQLLFECSGVKWDPGIAVEGNPDGGLIEVPLSGSMRRRGSDPPYKFTMKNSHNAAAVIAAG